PDTNPSQSDAQLEQAVFSQINQHRQSKGLAPLTLNATVSNQARQHSQNMAGGKVPFGHDGFEQRITTIRKEITVVSAGENVAFNRGASDPVKQAVTGWLNSPGHRRNIEGNFNLTGIGVSRNSKGEIYFTQIFIRKQ
ncbi:MAG: CAP domain-containing protein, partial [Nostocaceae cyanobacterium]|nr:CAP domain-containing protein [Nostocaceae cyanobacterium]